MKKLLYITPRIDGSGGLQRVLSVKMNYLIEQYRYQISVLVSNPKSLHLFYDFSKIDYVYTTIQGVGPFYLWNYIGEVKKAIRMQNPDIVVIVDNGYKGFLLPYFLRKMGVSLVFEQHGFRFYEQLEYRLSFLTSLKISILNRIFNYTLSFADRLVVLTDTGKREWRHPQVVTIPNPLWMRQNPELISRQKIVLAVGRHEYVKGYDLLIPLWKRVVHNHPDWVLHIYGEENPDLRLEDLVTLLGLTGQVVLKKPTLDIELAYAEASVFVMTSRHEGFGMALLEAMASGLPCVAYDCPTGPSALIEDHTSGFLIPMYEEGAFVEAMQTLLKNDSLRLQMGAEGKRIASGYALDRVMSEWHQLFSSL